jgi:hypothetical protein
VKDARAGTNQYVDQKFNELLAAYRQTYGAAASMQLLNTLLGVAEDTRLQGNWDVGDLFNRLKDIEKFHQSIHATESSAFVSQLTKLCEDLEAMKTAEASEAPSAT